MKMYAIIIRPRSPFGTPPKGDTLFGQFCWVAAENPDLLGQKLGHWLSAYETRPFAIFSSAWPLIKSGRKVWIALPRPPLSGNDPDIGNRRDKILRHKQSQKKKWLRVDLDLVCSLQEENLQSDEELFDLFLQGQNPDTLKQFSGLAQGQRRIVMRVNRAHNTINRQTQTTGSGMFAPYSYDNIQYAPGISLVIFAAADSQALDSQGLKAGFEHMGNWGFGRDATTGLGRFSVEEVREISWPSADDSHSACFTLGPSVPQKKTFSRVMATPFTRFGRHGAALAARNPFKNPVVMADEGALLYPVDRKKIFSRPWIGTAVRGISLADERTVMQGYSLYLPF